MFISEPCSSNCPSGTGHEKDTDGRCLLRISPETFHIVSPAKWIRLAASRNHTVFTGRVFVVSVNYGNSGSHNLVTVHTIGGQLIAQWPADAHQTQVSILGRLYRRSCINVSYIEQTQRNPEQFLVQANICTICCAKCALPIYRNRVLIFKGIGRVTSPKP